MSKRPLLVLGAFFGLLVVVSFYLWLRLYFVGITGADMEPTIRPGERVVVHASVGRVGRGDLVMFRRTGDAGESFFIKRVVALGGDVVQLRGAQVLVNGEPLRERRIFVAYGHEREAPRQVGGEGEGDYSVYYTEATRDGHGVTGFESMTAEPYRVPEGSLFTLGDNRDNSEDSRYWGPVPVARVMGRPVFVYAAETEGGLSLTYRVLR